MANKTFNISDVDQCHILAALWLYMNVDTLPIEAQAIATANGTFEPLDGDQISWLSQRMGGKPIDNPHDKD